MIRRLLLASQLGGGKKPVINIKWVMSEKISNSPIMYEVQFEMETTPSTLPMITLLGRGQEIGVFEDNGMDGYFPVRAVVYFTPTIDDFSLMPSEDDNYTYQIVQEL